MGYNQIRENCFIILVHLGKIQNNDAEYLFINTKLLNFMTVHLLLIF